MAKTRKETGQKKDKTEWRKQPDRGKKKTAEVKKSERSVKKALRIYSQDLITKIRTGKLNPKKLTDTERRACVTVLRHKPITKAATAAFLGISRPTLNRDLKVIRQGLGILVEGLTSEAIVGDFQDRSDHLYAMAIRHQDFALAWRIAQGTIATMQDLGYLRKVIGEYTEADRIDRMDDKELDSSIEEEIEFYQRAKLTIERGVRLHRKRTNKTPPAKKTTANPARKAVGSGKKKRKKGKKVIEI